MILRLQQLELIFDAVTGVGGGELELLREVGGARVPALRKHHVSRGGRGLRQR